MAIFSTSDGWIRVTPMCSQRRAPFDTSPNSATPISSARPARYSGMAVRIIVVGDRLAMAHMTMKEIAKLRR